jgi:TPP-dependent pyruvate/acetoin dehydrogenase alpha subunit
MFPDIDIASSLATRVYERLRLIRRVEERIADIYPSDRIKSPVHLSIGQEAVSVGVCEALRAGDVVFGTYRGHALYLAKGGDLRAMIAELYGKATGCARGRGGSMHLIDVAHGVMGMSAVVATTVPNAVGYAYALKYRRSHAIVVSFFGDGAVEEGAFFESVNFAALKKLPILFVCENNGYAIHTPLAARQAVTDIVAKIRAQGIPGTRVANDVFAVYEASRESVERIRNGSGPAFLECETYRWREHVGPHHDAALGYRGQGEIDGWVSRDPLLGIVPLVDEPIRRTIDAEIERQIADAVDFAERSPFPDPGELYDDVFKSH